MPSLVFEGREDRWVGEREVQGCIRVREGEAVGEVWVWGCEEGRGRGRGRVLDAGGGLMVVLGLRLWGGRGRVGGGVL